MMIGTSKRTDLIIGMVAFTIVALLLGGAVAFMYDWNVKSDLPPQPPKGYVCVAAQVENISWDFPACFTNVRFEYNETAITKPLKGNALVKKGSTITIYYNPRTEEIIYDFTTIGEYIKHLAPQSNTAFLLMVLGMYAVMIASFIINWRRSRGDNYIFGVVTDITAVPGAEEVLSPEVAKVLSMIGNGPRRRGGLTIGVAQQRFIVTCSFMSPKTGEEVIAKGVNDRPLKLNVGDGVNVLYNKRNPEASFVDVDGILPYIRD